MIPILAISVALVAGLAGWVLWQRRQLVRALPPIELCPDTIAANIAATRHAAELVRAGGGSAHVLPVLGTGSMAPYIRGGDPAGIVAWVVTDPRRGYADLRPGDLCLYHPQSDPGATWLHQAAELDAGGWIMTGLANRHHESWMRVTSANFVGVVAKTFTWAPPPPFSSP